MPLTLNGSSVTSNKLNNTNITNESLNEVKVFPTASNKWVLEEESTVTNPSLTPLIYTKYYGDVASPGPTVETMLADIESAKPANQNMLGDFALGAFYMTIGVIRVSVYRYFKIVPA